MMGHELEKKKYEWLSKNNSNYGSSFHGKDYVTLLKSLNYDSILDLGTGKGQLCGALYGHYKTIYGLDWLIEPDLDISKLDINFIKADAIGIPLPDKSIDITTSFDFFEHIHPDSVGKVFSEICRVTKRMSLHKINFSPSGGGPKHPSPTRKKLEAAVGNGELHPSVHDPNWWTDLFNRSLGKESVIRMAKERTEKGTYLILH